MRQQEGYLFQDADLIINEDKSVGPVVKQALAERIQRRLRIGFNHIHAIIHLMQSRCDTVDQEMMAGMAEPGTVFKQTGIADGNAVGTPHDQGFGGPVLRVAVPANNLGNKFLFFATDFAGGLVVQNEGHGRWADFGQSGNIFNGYGHILFDVHGSELATFNHDPLNLFLTDRVNRFE